MYKCKNYYSTLLFQAIILKNSLFTDDFSNKISAPIFSIYLRNFANIKNI